MTALEAALAYIALGWSPVPIPHRTKGPVIDGWQTIRATPETARSFFNGRHQNVGVILGEASNGLTDLDLDCPEAIAAAPYFLPRTAVFGHASKRMSHWLYRTTLFQTEERAAIKLMGSDKVGLLEVRTGGAGRAAQTVFPPSTHISGEPIDWEGGGPEDIAEVDDDELLRCANQLAACAELARNYPKVGGRHDAAFVLGGFLANAGWSVPNIRLFAEAVAVASMQPSDKKADMARTAMDGAQAGNKAGFPALAETFGKDTAKKLAGWLGYSGPTFDPRDRFDPGEPPPYEPPGQPSNKPQRPEMAIEWFDAAADSALDEPANPLIEDLLDEGAMSVFYGDSGSGKTFGALDKTFHVSVGLPWNGKKTKRGFVVYVAAEGGKRIKRRLAALKKRYREQHPDGPTPLFALIRYQIDLRSNDADLNKLLALVRKAEAETGEKCVWLVVDTLSRAMAGGDENSPVDMGRVVASADRLRAETGAHFTYVHHSGKDAARGARGHSLLRAATDTEVEYTERMVTVTKQRDGDTGFKIGFKLVDIEIGEDPDGLSIKSAVVEWEPAKVAEARAKKETPPKSMTMLMEVVKAAIDQTGAQIRPFHDGPLVMAASETAVRLRFDVRMADQAEPGEDPAKLADRKRNNFRNGVAAALKREALMAGFWMGERYLWLPR